MDDRPTCFVVMGFNEKTDPITGRVLDLDKSYRGIIKPAAEAAGYRCFRADEIQHAGVIDVPMYEWLLRADLVIADLSTLNANAFFELGVRYALRPYATIVIAEDGFRNPFDTNHITARTYRHDGKSLDFEVVEAFRGKLTAAIKEIAAAKAVDSPVYTFLKGLSQPRLEAILAEANVEAEAAAIQRANEDGSEAAQAAVTKPLKAMIDMALALREKSKFAEMAAILTGLRAAYADPADSFVLQQLAFATYKAGQPNPTQALLDAREILRPLDPRRGLNAETIGLWGAIHKRLAFAEDRTDEEKAADLNEAIDALERGFRLLRDFYNGINAAFVYDVRAHRTGGEEAAADRVIARRIRIEVKSITSELLESPIAGESERDRRYRAFWIKATEAEAMLGLGDRDAAAALLDAAARQYGAEEWMVEVALRQQADLAAVLP